MFHRNLVLPWFKHICSMHLLYHLWLVCRFFEEVSFSHTCTCCCSPGMLMICGDCCSFSWAVPPCVFTCSEVGDWVGMWACVWWGNWLCGLADAGAAVVASGVVPAWTGVTACWVGRAGLLMEAESAWPGTVVAGLTEETKTYEQRCNKVHQNYKDLHKSDTVTLIHELCSIPEVQTWGETWWNMKFCCWFSWELWN